MGEHPVLVSHQVEAARTSSRAAAKPRHSMPCSCLLALSVLLLGCCHLCSCQLELQQAAEEPRVVFGEWVSVGVVLRSACVQPLKQAHCLTKSMLEHMLP